MATKIDSYSVEWADDRNHRREEEEQRKSAKAALLAPLLPLLSRPGGPEPLLIGHYELRGVDEAQGAEEYLKEVGRRQISGAPRAAGHAGFREQLGPEAEGLRDPKVL